MLPYRLRPPVYGGKLKQKKEQEGISFDDRSRPYREGGPVERAVRADLLALLPAFEEKLRQIKPSDSSEHTATGLAFAAFKDVFGSNRVAMLNRAGDSGLLPTKCDRNSYSQMLYSVCLSMMRQSFRDHSKSNENQDSGNDSLGVFLRQAAYGVFTLYALYETNPLPRGPSSESSKEEYLALLPMGITNPEHGRATYRRAFRSPIRIDTEHYGYLLQLRDLARAERCQCAASMRKNYSQQDNGEQVDAQWECECAVATDLCVILDRILSSNMLEFSSYTGPCGLEGLAGHADYTPIPPRPQPTDGPSAAAVAAAVAADNDNGASLEGVGELPAPFESSSGLDEQLQKYVSDRAAIRLPAERPNMPQKEKRIREALQSVFAKKGEHGQHSKVDPLMSLLSSGGRREQDEAEDPQKQQKRIRLRRHHVSFGTVVVHDEAAAEKVAAAPNETTTEEPPADANSVKPNSTEVSQPSYELVLPNSLSSEQQTGLQSIVETLLDRDESLLLPFGGGRGETPSHAGDEISTLGDGSTVSNVGRTALQNLLSQLGSPAEKTDASALQARAAGDFFLARTEVGDGGAKSDDEADNDNSEFSGLSSSEDEMEETSVAASRVGQKALQDLLSTAVGKSLGTETRSKKQKSRSGTIAAEMDEVESSDEDEFEPSDKDEDTEEETSVAASRVGQRALQDLLSSAAGKSHAKKSTKNQKASPGKGPAGNVDKRNLPNDELDEPLGLGQKLAGKEDAAKAAKKPKGRPRKKPTAAKRRSPRRASRENNAESDDNEEESKASSDEESDGTSVAASRVGQTALQNLLSSAVGESNDQAAVKQRSSRSSKGKAKAEGDGESNNTYSQSS